MDAILSDQPNALIIITGDFNPNSTGLQSKEIAQPNHLKQLVKFKTRVSGILVWMFVNKPKMFDLTRLQRETKMAKHHYYNNRVSKLENTSSSKWWREIERLSGQDIKHEWHH